MDDIYLFQSLVAFGPIKECRKLIRLVDTHNDYRYFESCTCGFANFCSKSTDVDSSQLNLQQISARTIAEKYGSQGWQKSDIESLPEELLAKIVDAVPLFVPAKQDAEAAPKVAFNLNFEERDSLCQIIKDLRPDLDDSFAEQFDNREGILYYSFFRKFFTIPSVDQIPKILKEHNINVTIVGRDSCDWDNPANNSFTRIFVIENNEVTFRRADLPQEIKSDDHPAVHKYGHLLKTWKEIKDESRTEFTSETLGEFKQFWKYKLRLD